MNYRLKICEDIISAACDPPDRGRFTAAIGERRMEIAVRRLSPFQLQLIVDGKNVPVFINEQADYSEIWINGEIYTIEDADLVEQRAVRKTSRQAVPSEIVPPMPSSVVRIMAAEGDRVEQSQPLIVLSAMKMETTLTAPYAGIISKIHVKEGDKAAANQILMDIEKNDD